MNSFRFTALCAILTAFSAQVMQASSGSSSSNRMIGENGAGIYNGGKIPASIPKAPISVAVALQKDDPKVLNLHLKESKAHKGNTGRNDTDINKFYNWTNSKIAPLLPANKVMTIKQAADYIGATKCSKVIAKQPELITPAMNKFSNNSSSMTANPGLSYSNSSSVIANSEDYSDLKTPEVADEMENNGMES